MNDDWQCPTCKLRCQLDENRSEESVATLMADNALGPRGFRLRFVVCPNQDCRMPHATLSLHSLFYDEQGTLGATEEAERTWTLLPSAGGSQLPSYVPESAAEDHRQAVEIRDISPNAAGALARRCLQGLVRDFWNVKKNSLADELGAIQEKVDPETWDAIEAVRSMGRIARQLDKGVNLIQEATQEEVTALLGLIEYLVEDWYGARQRRQQRLAKLKELGGGEAERFSKPPRP